MGKPSHFSVAVLGVTPESRVPGEVKHLSTQRKRKQFSPLGENHFQSSGERKGNSPNRLAPHCASRRLRSLLRSNDWGSGHAALTRCAGGGGGGGGRRGGGGGGGGGGPGGVVRR